MSSCGKQSCLLLYRMKNSVCFSWDAGFQDGKRCHLCVERRKVSSSVAKPSICRAVDSYRERTKKRQLSVYVNSLIHVKEIKEMIVNFLLLDSIKRGNKKNK